MCHMVDITKPFTAAFSGTVEYREMLQLQMGRTFNGHGAANIVVRRFIVVRGSS